MCAAADTADLDQAGGAGHHHDGDPAKRRQIVAGARKVFLERGFAGASMGEIARVAGVSKGTLYVYFQDKEQMFCAILDEERRKHLETVFTLDDTAGTRETLVTFGRTLTRFITEPGKIAAMRTANKQVAGDRMERTAFMEHCKADVFAAASQAQPTAGAPLEGANSFTENQAKDRAAAAGFTEVSALQKDDKGIWRGTAKRGSSQVNIAIDFKGNVVAQ